MHYLSYQAAALNRRLNCRQALITFIALEQSDDSEHGIIRRCNDFRICILTCCLTIIATRSIYSSALLILDLDVFIGPADAVWIPTIVIAPPVMRMIAVIMHCHLLS